MRALDDALAAARRGDVATALAAALAAWRLLPAAQLAALVELLGARAGLGRAVVAGTQGVGIEAMWRAIDAAGDPADLDRLLAAVAKGTAGAVRGRLRTLATRRDPRVATALLALVTTPPSPHWQRESSANMWAVVLAALEQVADPRTRAAIYTIPWMIRGESPYDGSRLRAYLATELARIARATAEAPVLDPVDAATCDAIVRALGPLPPSEGDALLARIYEHPDDLALRAVYADWLLERQDPRGELIALQLRRAIDAPPSGREWQLLKFHTREWLGPLGEQLLYPVFQRGFLFAATTYQVERLDDPALATIERLTARLDTAAAGAALASPRWRELRHAETFTWDGLAGLLAAIDRPLALASIAVAGDLRPLPPLSALPALRAIDLHACDGEASPAEAAAMFRAPVFRALDTFVAPRFAWLTWLEAFCASDARGLALRHIPLRSQIALRVERHPELHLAIRVPRYERLAFDDIRALRPWWPKHLVPRVRLIPGPGLDHEDRGDLLDLVRTLDPEAVTSP